MVAKLADRLKISLDELRMQVLGAQVLLGFQFQSLFQPGFDRALYTERIADGAALTAILLSFAVLLAAPAQHRLVEGGEASERLLQVTNRCAEAALATMAIAFGCIASGASPARRTGLLTALIDRGPPARRRAPS